MPVYKKTTKTGKVSWYAIFYYRDWNGQRKQKKKEGFSTQREAKAYERDFLERRAATPSMTFAALVDIYLEDYKSRNRATTYQTTENIINTHILPAFRDLPINEITPATIRSWQNTLLSSGKYADSYLSRVHVSLSSMFNFAVKYCGLASNPARLAGSIGKTKSHTMSFWTLEQFKACQQITKEPYTTIFTMLFYTGLREGELLALTPGDIDPQAGTLAVTKTYKRIGKEDIIQPPKTEKSRRVISLPPFLVDMLQQYISTLYGIKDDQRIFECVGVTAMRKTLDKYAAAAGLPRIRVHDLRHSHASLLIEQGFSPVVIRDRLGHEDIQTTLNTYSHLYPNKQEEIASRLEELGTPKEGGSIARP